jgi:alkanesulfonate monooxygenase SsuD/methylene tetrahydromethanopterin reductase-like flavin-dependent oxidoreductase (luciferase family)
MRIGISVNSAYPPGDVRAGAHSMVERARAARDAQLDSLFVGDHHVTATPYYQNSPILGRMLAEWNANPAGALYLLPLWNPVVLAEQVGTLAAIMQGRFVLQCSLGGDRRQSRGVGVDPARRVGMFEASLDLMRRLWAGETVTSSRYWQIEGARIAPVPAEPVEVWIGAVAPVAIERTARLADGWLAAPALTLEQAIAGVDGYRSACARAGRTPSAVAIRKDVYVGASAEEARAVVAPYLERGYRGFDPASLVYGSVEQVAEQLAAYGEAGYTDVIVRNLVSDQRQALECIARLGTVRGLIR